MARFQYTTGKLTNGANVYVLPEAEFAKFNSSYLNLGDLRIASTPVQALAAVLDLQGFTEFCDQRDPHLSVPRFLSMFLDWVFKEIGRLSVQERRDENVYFYGALPFWAKFTGDGVLFLWDLTTYGQMTIIANTMLVVSALARTYPTVFLPTVQSEFINPPKRLRIGMAVGQISSIGDSHDYVGQCINLASRIQKLGTFTAAMSSSGLVLTEAFNPEVLKLIAVISTKLRGVTKPERIIILKEEFDALPAKDKKKFDLIYYPKQKVEQQQPKGA